MVNKGFNIPPPMNYYIALNGTQAGPYPEQKIREMLASGEITSESLAWKEGLADWVPLGSILPTPTAGALTAVPAPGLPPQAGEWVLASLGSRFVAACLDMVPFLLAASIFAIAMVVTGARRFEDLPQAIQFALMGAFVGGLVLIGVVQIYMLVKYSQTIGKRICKIRIYNLETRQPADWVRSILLRIFVNGLVGAIPCVGGLYSLVDVCFIFRADRRCIHDLIAGTVVGTVPGD